MKELSLTKGKFALIDDEDYYIISFFTWYAAKDENTFYANTSVRLNNKLIILRMHRFLLNLKSGEQVDHRDGNGLNNQKANLRICTHSQNCMNMKGHKNSTSKFKGVSWNKRYNRWVAQICLNRNIIFLGYFKNEVKAAGIYDTKAKELFGNFARLNF